MVYAASMRRLGIVADLNARAVIVVFVFTEIGALYCVLASVGSLPSVVYRMTAPVVAQEILTLCVPV